MSPQCWEHSRRPRRSLSSSLMSVSFTACTVCPGHVRIHRKGAKDRGFSGDPRHRLCSTQPNAATSLYRSMNIWSSGIVLIWAHFFSFRLHLVSKGNPQSSLYQPAGNLSVSLTNPYENGYFYLLALLRRLRWSSPRWVMKCGWKSPRLTAQSISIMTSQVVRVTRIEVPTEQILPSWNSEIRWAGSNNMHAARRRWGQSDHVHINSDMNVGRAYAFRGIWVRT